MSDKSDDNKTSALRADVQEAADQVTDTARQAAHDAAGRASDQVAGEVDTMAEAAGAASDSFDPGSLQARASEEISAQLQSAAARLRATDLEDAVAGVSRFARQNPALFLGGVALAGFAMGRFLKASQGDAPRTATRDTRNDPWTGHASATPMPAASGYSNGRADA